MGMRLARIADIPRPSGPTRGMISVCKLFAFISWFDLLASLITPRAPISQLEEGVQSEPKDVRILQGESNFIQLSLLMIECVLQLERY